MVRFAYLRTPFGKIEYPIETIFKRLVHWHLCEAR